MERRTVGSRCLALLHGGLPRAPRVRDGIDEDGTADDDTRVRRHLEISDDEDPVCMKM